MRTLRDELPDIALACISGLCFALFIWLIRELPLVGEETQAELAETQQAREFEPETAPLSPPVKLEETKIPLTAEPEEPEEPEPEPAPEPQPKSKNGRAEFRIEPKTDIEDYYACRDELIRRGVSECGGEPYLGMIAVFQVMYDRMYNMNAGYESLHDMLSVKNAFAAPYEYDISPWEPEISLACDAVFLHGERAFDVVTKYFYNPYYSSPEGKAFMEAQPYVECIGNHIFCTEWKYIDGTSYDGVNPYASPKETI